MDTMHRLKKNIRNISVYGCGGTGSQMINGLARINHAQKQRRKPEIYVTAYDFDTVSPANIGRQAFFPSDVGHNKAKILIDRVNAYYQLNWKYRTVKAPSSSKDDMIISCVDTIKSREDIAKSWLTKEAYMIDCGNARTSGQVLIGQFDGDLPNVYDEHNDLIYGEEPEDEVGCVDEYFVQDLFVNSVVAINALNLIWRLLRWESLKVRGVFFDTDEGICNPVKI
jgi:PRTRC genetic system ThiF family protein